MKKNVFALFLICFLAACGGSGGSFSLETENGDNVVVGKGLMWYYSDGSDPLHLFNQTAYSEAVKFCDDLDYAGHNDWRLPTIDELRGIVEGYSDIESGGRCKVTSKCLQTSCVIKGQKNGNDTPCSNPDTEIMQGNGPKGCYFDDVWGDFCGKYWSSSAVQGAADMSFQLDFSDPAIIAATTTGMSSFGYARCVRKK